MSAQELAERTYKGEFLDELTFVQKCGISTEVVGLRPNKDEAMICDCDPGDDCHD